MSISLKKHPMPEQDPKVRAGNFEEVALGYTAELAQAEAARCLQCKTAPCRQGCPVEIDIPAFIAKIKDGDMDGAIGKIKEVNALPAVCGRVCPQEDQCEKYCVLAKKGESVAIGRLERYVADLAREQGGEQVTATVRQDAMKVAVIGSGPAGLSVAGDLAKKGYRVTVFEALHLPGGVLMYGIPQFRLPKEVVQAEIDVLRKLGVEFVVNAVIGRTFTVDELLEVLARIDADWEWHLAGEAGLDPDYAEGLRERIRQLGLSHRVVWHGSLPPDELARQMASMDLFVSNSALESYGMALAEAAAIGLPILATAVGEAERLIVDGKTGLIIPVHEADLFEQALARLLTDRAFRRSLEARANPPSSDRV